MRRLAFVCAVILALVTPGTIGSVALEPDLPVWDEQTRDAPLSFAMGDYGQVHSLSVDPKLLWHTFFGSADEDRAYGAAVDGSGNLYIAGWSAATWGEDPVRDYSEGDDAFVAKFNSDGALQWHTFLGGTGDDYGMAIVVDDAGETIYVSGESYAGWGEPIISHAGDRDVFVAKLNVEGALQWLTFMGSEQADSQNIHGALEVDGSGNVYVGGVSYAAWGDDPINDYAGMVDVFVAKLSASGVRQWNTFIGAADGNDASYGIAVDAPGNIYVSGWSGTSWGTPADPFIENIAGWSNALVVKLDTDGDYQWHTFLGGEGDDVSYGGIGLDVNTGKVYVAGSSNRTWGTPIDSHQGDYDVFVAQLDSTTGSRQWHTFFGSSNYDYAYGAAISGNGNIYITGYSRATWGDPILPYSDREDAFVAQLSPDGERQFHVFLGGTEDDRGHHLVMDPVGEKIDVVGYSDATWGEPLSPFQGGRDAFLAKIDLAVTALISVSVAGPETGWVDTSYPFTATVSPISATMPITYVWQATNQDTVTHTDSFSDSVSFSWAISGSKEIIVAATNVSGTVTDSHIISIDDQPVDVVALDSVTIAGPATGVTDTVYSFIASVSPVTATMPITYVWQAADQDMITHTGNLSDSVSFSWAAAGNKDILVAATNVSGTVTDSHTISITERVVALDSVTIAGPTTGVTGTVYSFIASVSHVTATTPITYVWQATGQATVTHTGSFSDSVSLSWATTGSKDILVAATNVSGTVTDSHTISITRNAIHKCYLPLTHNNFFCDVYEPNDSRPKNGGSPPGLFTPGETIQAKICSTDPRDLYYVDLTAGKTVIFTLSNMPSNVNFELYLWDENSDIPKAKSEKGAGQDEGITYAVPVTGQYYVDVYPKQGTGAYSLRYQ